MLKKENENSFNEFTELKQRFFIFINKHTKHMLSNEFCFHRIKIHKTGEK